MRSKKLIIMPVFLAVIMVFSQFGSFVPVTAAGPGNAAPASIYKPGDEIVPERTDTAKKFFLGNNTYALDISLGGHPLQG
jgi:hypothetical protein